MATAFSLIVPRFNEAGRMEHSLRPMLSYVDRHRLRGEVILVDDGIRDDTLDRARELLRRHENSPGTAISPGVN